MKIFFWNTNNLIDFLIIESILLEVKPDILFLAEFDSIDLNSKIADLRSLGYSYFPNPGCSKIKIIVNVSLSFGLSLQHNDYSAVYFKKFDLHIVSLHMPSQKNYHFDSLKSNLSNFKSEIENSIGFSNLTKILIIGDFNVSPFETPMIHFDGMAATNTIITKQSKKFRTQTSTLFYNPTWKLYANNKFPGTYYKSRPSNSSFDIMDHHFLDQVILSQSLAMILKTEKIEILEKTSKYTIFDSSKNKIKISDHLPIIYEFTL